MTFEVKTTFLPRGQCKDVPMTVNPGTLIALFVENQYSGVIAEESVPISIEASFLLHNPCGEGTRLGCPFLGRLSKLGFTVWACCPHVATAVVDSYNTASRFFTLREFTYLTVMMDTMPCTAPRERPHSVGCKRSIDGRRGTATSAHFHRGKSGRSPLRDRFGHSDMQGEASLLSCRWIRQFHWCNLFSVSLTSVTSVLILLFFPFRLQLQHDGETGSDGCQRIHLDEQLCVLPSLGSRVLHETLEGRRRNSICLTRNLPIAVRFALH